jgi:hypothetical protein
MGRERSGDCTETGGSAVMSRLPRFLHACDRGRFRGVCLCPAWPKGNRRFERIHWACARGVLKRVLACIGGCCGHPNEPFSAPQGLVQLFTGYQSRPKASSPVSQMGRQTGRLGTPTHDAVLFKRRTQTTMINI